MKKIIPILAAIIVCSFTAKSQDVIIKNDKTEIKTKILEVRDDVIKYKKFDNQEGPTYSIKKSEVLMIMYQNGTKEIIEHKAVEPIVEPVQKAAPNLENNVKHSNYTNNASRSSNNLPILKGENHLSLGLGLGSAIGSFGTSTKTPPLSISYDIAVTDEITVGPYLAYTSTGGTEYYYDNSANLRSYAYTYSHTIVGVKGKYHFEVSNKFSAYVGAILGYHSVSYKDDAPYPYNYSSTAKGSTILLSAHIGGAYELSNHSYVFAELGYGISYLNLGYSFKL